LSTPPTRTPPDNARNPPPTEKSPADNCLPPQRRPHIGLACADSRMISTSTDGVRAGGKKGESFAAGSQSSCPRDWFGINTTQEDPMITDRFRTGPVIALLVALTAGCDGISFNSGQADPDGADAAGSPVESSGAVPVDTDEHDTAPVADAFVETHTLTPHPDGCIAPARDEYMARFGVAATDTDLDDENVLAAKEHTILFIFDKSGSMQDEWNDDAAKWDVARDAMTAAVAPFTGYVTAGALFFPMPPASEEDFTAVASIDSGLQIDYADGEDFMDTWNRSMDRYAAGGSTPLMDAMHQADAAIDHACLADILTRPFKVVLITDGMPDWYDRDQSLALVKKWFDAGIETRVVGLPGSTSAAGLLADIAAVGSGGEAAEIMLDEEAEPVELTDEMLILCE